MVHYNWDDNDNEDDNDATDDNYNADDDYHHHHRQILIYFNYDDYNKDNDYYDDGIRWRSNNEWLGLSS